MVVAPKFVVKVRVRPDRHVHLPVFFPAKRKTVSREWRL